MPAASDYIRNESESHKRPAPTVGTPCLVWHLAFSPKTEEDPARSAFEVDSISKKLTVYDAAAEKNLKLTSNFTHHFNTLILKLQNKGRAGVIRQIYSEANDSIDVATHIPEPKGSTIDVVSSDAIGFTMWWSSSGDLREYDKESGKAPAHLGRKPNPDAMRVRVQSERHEDFFLLTIYMDVSSVWIEPESRLGEGWRPTYDAEKPDSHPHIDAIRKAQSEIVAIGEHRFRENNFNPLNKLITKEKELQNTLQKHTQVLYEEAWNAFCEHVQINFINQPFNYFTNVKGVSLSVRDEYTTSERQHTISIKAPNFSNVNDDEATKTLLAYWPFIDRVTPNADFTEHLAFQIFGRRVIFVSPLGAGSELSEGDEFAPDGTVSTVHKDLTVGSRYLVLVKGQPQARKALPQQLGRLFLNIGHLATFRRFALKDLNYIQKSGQDIRLRGQQLDAITARWSSKRIEIENRYSTEKRNFAKEEELAKLAESTESDLMHINAALNNIGAEATGGLPYRINKSKLYTQMFLDVERGLAEERIEGWLQYDDFIERRLKPTFDLIEGVGQRLTALRNRLNAALSGVQTGAIVRLSRVTAGNTEELKNFQKSTDGLAGVGVILGGVTIAANTGLQKTEIFSNLKGSVETQIERLTGLELSSDENSFYSWIFAITLSIILVSCIAAYMRLRGSNIALLICDVFMFALAAIVSIKLYYYLKINYWNWSDPTINIISVIAFIVVVCLYLGVLRWFDAKAGKR